MDGHQSHRTLEAIELARDNGIIMLTLPPHCTHRTQPLHRTFLKSLKLNYNAACDERMRCHPGRSISFSETAELFHRAYVISSRQHTRRRCMALSVQAYGLTTHSCFLEDFEAAKVTNEDDPAVQAAVVREDSDSDTETHLDQSCDDVGGADAEPTTTAECQEETVNSDPSVAAAELDNSAMNATPCPSHPGLAEALEILQSMSPRHKISKPRARKRKTESSAVIMSSPYKQALQEKQQIMGSKSKDERVESKQEQEMKSSSKTKDKKDKKKTQSTLSSDETPCLYCEQPYCNPVEGFVQCGSRPMWALHKCRL